MKPHVLSICSLLVTVFSEGGHPSHILVSSLSLNLLMTTFYMLMESTALYLMLLISFLTSAFIPLVTVPGNSVIELVIIACSSGFFPMYNKIDLPVKA